MRRVTRGMTVVSVALIGTACLGGLGSDDLGPDLEIVTPLGGEIVSGAVEISVSAFDNETEVKEVRFFVDNALLLTDTQRPFSASWDTRSYPDGPHGIRVEAEDTEGHSSQVSIVVTVSNTPN